MSKFQNSIITARDRSFCKLQSESQNHISKSSQQNTERDWSKATGEMCLLKVPSIKVESSHNVKEVDEKDVSKVFLMMKFVSKTKHPVNSKLYSSNELSLEETSSLLNFNSFLKRISTKSNSKKQNSTNRYENLTKEKRNYSKITKFKPVLQNKKSYPLPPLNTKSNPSLNFTKTTYN